MEWVQNVLWRKGLMNQPQSTRELSSFTVEGGGYIEFKD